MTICPEASKARNSIATISAQDRKVSVSICRLNSLHSSMALLVRIALSRTKALRDVVVAYIRVPASALEAIAPQNGRTQSRPLARRLTPGAGTYKCKRGAVLILVGEAVAGASCLTTLEASRAGAGMVTLATPSEVWNIFVMWLIKAIVHGFRRPRRFRSLAGR